jgi:hypothetical protein
VADRFPPLRGIGQAIHRGDAALIELRVADVQLDAREVGCVKRVLRTLGRSPWWHRAC